MRSSELAGAFTAVSPHPGSFLATPPPLSQERGSDTARCVMTKLTDSLHQL
jgi:hypothetical protein